MAHACLYAYCDSFCSYGKQCDGDTVREKAEKHWNATPEMLKLLSTRAYITVFFIIYYDCGNVVIISSS